MDEKILCRYCANGVPMVMALSHTHMICPVCRSTSPYIIDPHTTSVKQDELVIAAAKRRYEPKLKPMTIEEVFAYTKEKDAPPLLWEDLSGGMRWALQASLIRGVNIEKTDMADAIKKVYGRSYRLWRCNRIPTDEERRAAAWL